MENNYVKKYNDLKDRICMSMHDHLVDSNEEFLSVFELIREANICIKDLINIKEMNPYIVQVLNEALKDNIMLSNESDENIKYLKRFIIDRVEPIIFQSNNFIDIVLHRKRGIKSPHYYKARVGKNVDNSLELVSVLPYYTNNKSSINKCINFIKPKLLEIFSILEKNEDFIDAICNINHIKTDLFKINIVLGSDGFYPVIKPNTDNVDEDIYYNELISNQSLYEFVEQNADLILWSIPVFRVLLPQIVNNKIDEVENTKIKLLIKEINK